MTDAVPPLAQPGQRLLGKYVVERVLGQGGMGCVVAVRHDELGHRFAIKLMRADALKDPEALERFQREARAAAKLKNEHTARVHDVGRLEDGTPYMLMDHLSGRDLATVLYEDGPLPLDRAASYVLEVLQALEEAHALGIIHRDIKPANLFLVDGPDGSRSVKVLDFGVAKHSGPDASVGLTKTRAVFGSPFFMSPEQMLSTRSVDRRTDVWAIGVTLYQLTTGALPFDGEVIAVLVTRVHHTEPVPPSQLVPSLPAGFDAVVLRCLAKKPDDRYGSCAELAAALAPFAAEPAEPIEEAPATMPLINPASFGGQSRTELLARPVETVKLPFEPPPPPPLFKEGPKPVVRVPEPVAAPPIAPPASTPAPVAAPLVTPVAPKRRSPLWLVALIVGLIAVGLAVALTTTR